MNQLRVGVFLPFISDRWHSIERFSSLLLEQTGTVSSDIQMRALRPKEAWKVVSEKIARRGVYTLAAALGPRQDVYHISDPAYSHLIQFLPRARTVITCHDLEFWKARSQGNERLRRWILNSMWKAHAITTPSARVKDELLILAREQGVQAPPISVIHNSGGVAFQPPQDREALRRQWTWGPRPVLLNIANTTWPRKNFSFLLELVAQLRPIFPDLLFVQVGPDFTTEHRSQIQKLGLESCLDHRQNISEKEITQLYQAADLYLHPSTYEGFGYPLLEATGCRTPFLASNLEVFRELFPVKNSLLDLNLDVWRERCRVLLQDPKARAEVLHEQAALSQLYSWRAQVSAFAELYASTAQA